MLRDNRFRLSAGIIFVLLLVALGAGWKHYQDTDRQREAAREEAREVWTNQGEKNPHSAAHYGTYAFKPQMPLSFVDQGVNAYVGTAVYLEAHKQNNFKYLPVQDRTSLQRFGELTAAIVLQLLIPLLIILLTFAAFAGEREGGTLRQLLSLGVRARDLAFGKSLGIAGALLLLLVPATLIGVLALMLGSTTEILIFSLPRMLWLVIGYLLYFGAFLGLSLAVSARASSARLALVVLLGFWIVSGLVAPRVAADVSKRIVPTPSSAMFFSDVVNEIKNGMDGHNPQDKRVQALKEQTLKQYGVDQVEKLPINFGGLSLQASEEYGNQVFDKHFNDLWDDYERQSDLQQVGGLVAPLLAIRSLSMGMAGTDFAHHRRFSTSAEDYRRRMVKTLNLDLAYNSKSGETYMAGRSLWERIPDFEYRMPNTKWAIGNQIISIIVLVLWFALSTAAALTSVERMKVE